MGGGTTAGSRPAVVPTPSPLIDGMAPSSVTTQDWPRESVATIDLQGDCVALCTDIPDTTSGALDFAVDEDRLHTFENVESTSMNTIVDV